LIELIARIANFRRFFAFIRFCIKHKVSIRITNACVLIFIQYLIWTITNELAFAFRFIEHVRRDTVDAD